MRDFDLRFYLWIFLQRLPLVAAILTTSVTIGILASLVIPPKYRAEARIAVESPQIAANLAPSTVLERVAEQVQSIELELMSRPNLLAVAEKFELYRDRAELSEDEIVRDMRSLARVEPVHVTSAPGGSGTIAFAVTFMARNPELAADVTNHFATTIMERNLEVRTRQARETLSFFEQEAARIGRDLSRLDSEILTFKNAHSTALPDSLSFRRIQQASYSERLQQLEREEASLRDRRSRLLQLYEQSGETALAGVLSPSEQALEQLRRALIDQSMIYSESSPSVSAVRDQISALEREIEADRSAARANQKRARRISEKDLQLADIEGRLAFIEHDKSQISRALTELDSSIADTPANETILNSLDRERQNVQTQYNLAVTRLSDASTGQQIELHSKGERLSVLERAVPPDEPNSPRRAMIVFASLLAGAGIAAGLVVGLELLDKSVRRAVELLGIELQPLLAIPYIAVPGESSTRSASLVSAMVLPPLAGGLLILLLHNFGQHVFVPSFLQGYISF